MLVLNPSPSPMNLFDTHHPRYDSPAATAPPPQLRLHVTNHHTSNATAGPSRLNPITLDTVKVEALPFTSGDDSDDTERLQRQRTVQVTLPAQRVGGSLDYHEVLARQGSALIPNGKGCKWAGCSRELISLDILEKHARTHITYQPDPVIDIEEPQKSTSIACRWGNCKETFDSRGAAITHLHEHLSWYLRVCPVRGCTVREKFLSKAHLESEHPDLSIHDLPLNSAPRFINAIPPRAPPPLPSFIPPYLLGNVANPKVRTTRQDRRRTMALIKPRKSKARYFRGAAESTTFHSGVSSSIFHVELPHVDDVPVGFDPVHCFMDDVMRIREDGQKGPKVPLVLAPAPTLQPDQPITLVKRERKRQALTSAFDVVLRKGGHKKRKIMEVVMSSDEQLDRAATKGAGASFGAAFQYERLRLQGKMDERSPVGDGPFGTEPAVAVEKPSSRSVKWLDQVLNSP